MTGLDASTACPGCGIESSENYLGRRLCWPCYLALEAQVERECRGDNTAIVNRLNGMRDE